ncbi:putative mannosyltransferase [Serendipita vermifera]|nr:putative mannosyltransferase [Serendipita vermifera]
MQSMEDRFNRKYNYPYVFLNDEPFTDEFKEWTSRLASSKTEYGVIPKGHWNQPDWIDENKAKAARQKMVDENIIYGGFRHDMTRLRIPRYRNMCRFNSGFFFRHELVQPYRWYWRIEPGIDFYCDLDYDPFLSMEDNNQVYGFNIALYEYEETIPTLWKATKEFIEKHPQYVAKGNAMGFISKDQGKTYSLCHFWSNFEIADMEFWRGDAYTEYFNWLEARGGFYYERWGDAPVHSIAAALFLKKEQIRFFDEIGYRHDYIQHCPSGDAHKQGRCSCSPDDSFDWD